MCGDGKSAYVSSLLRPVSIQGSGDLAVLRADLRIEKSLDNGMGSALASLHPRAAQAKSEFDLVFGLGKCSRRIVDQASHGTGQWHGHALLRGHLNWRQVHKSHDVWGSADRVADLFFVDSLRYSASTWQALSTSDSWVE